ncbi:4Fe-4S ferredoxin iron-sulfur binding domain-containing protein [Syntrophobotulus glycolicus DSM 8271]|uniref:4Fe-4S ferredoxin iron-sulfur binding domain-containing protein n=1 Tax=Syntrophobotulus glycolicus (strain DSM 8271 / FlGlyR) TaxID=645991 RepID=F0SV70_SYNGF|nr:EFR1 family ferrodoxin [Syntrophobotulus glycolicus]ADY55570.1 4Fe-4S ferredoxin iron-sulfur binding domain-containing protein [Syntrophobotulus glycolicus DSM 8271]
MGTTIFYFTGTGNSLMLSRDLAKEIGSAKVISIAKAIQEPQFEMKDECIGFVFPLHYQGVPVIVQNFIEKLPMDKVNYIFGIVSSGAFIGDALKQLSTILSRRGKELSAGFQLLLPYNFIIDPFGLKAPGDEKRERLFKQEKLRVKEIAGMIKERKRIGIEKRPFLLLRHVHPYSRAAKEKLASELINGAKNFWVDNHCISCGRCKSVCPVNNIDILNEKPKWNEKCKQCLACINWCSQNAIQYKDRTLNKKRYTNPFVTVEDMVDSAGKY